jgi:hypothetical protein
MVMKATCLRKVTVSVSSPAIPLSILNVATTDVTSHRSLCEPNATVNLYSNIAEFHRFSPIPGYYVFAAHLPC